MSAVSTASIRKIVKFFSEILTLKRVERSGGEVVGAPKDHVGSHVAMAAQIAYVLAVMENEDPEKCASMVLFHDNPETRLGERHRISRIYVPTEEAELKVIEDQLKGLPKETKEGIMALFKERKKGESPEAKIAKDADQLEAAFQAKLWLEMGYKGAKQWIDRIKKALSTKSAKAILAEVEKTANFTNCWWAELGKRIVQQE